MTALVWFSERMCLLHVWVMIHCWKGVKQSIPVQSKGLPPCRLERILLKGALRPSADLKSDGHPGDTLDLRRYMSKFVLNDPLIESQAGAGSPRFKTTLRFGLQSALIPGFCEAQWL
jgi:hypothetical protein